MKALWAIAVKDLRVLRRDPMGLFFALGFPILMALFFGFIFGGGEGTGKVSLALVDEDGSDGSRDYLARLQASPAVEAKPLSLEEARTAVRRGKLVAYIRLAPGFGDLQGFFPNLQQVEVGIDPSRTAEKGILEGLLVQTAFQGTQNAIGDPQRMTTLIDRERQRLGSDADMPSELRRTMSGFFDGLSDYYAKRPAGESAGTSSPPNPLGGFDVRFASIAADDEGPRSSFEITFPAAMLWGLLGCTASFALSLVNERTTGTLQRLRLAPLTEGQVMSGKALACGLGCLGVLAVLTALGHLVFKMRVVSWPLLAAAALCTALCFVGIMMFVSVLGTTPRSVSGSGWAIFLVMSMFGGGTVPLIAMPAWMQKASSLSPVKWGIVALEGAIWRGFSWREMALPCSILLAVGAAGFAIGVRRMHRLDAR